MIWPVKDVYTISQLYYSSSGSQHSTRYGYNKCIDIAATDGTPVYATEAGSVITSTALRDTNGNYRSFGEYIEIKHGDGAVSLYAHLQKRNVTVGQNVSKGDIIGWSGHSGKGTGAHLHFEYSKADPWLECFREKYYTSLKYQPNCYTNNKKYNSDQTICKWLDEYYILSNGNYTWNGKLLNCNCSESYAGNYTCTSNTTLNIRNGHSTSSSVIGSIPHGATVYVSKGDGTWAHVEYNGVSGYASMNCLSKYTLDSRFSDFVPFKSYAISTDKISVYDVNGNLYSNRYIDGSSETCTINEIYTDGWCKVTYPSQIESSGYFTAYTPLSTFIENLSLSEWTVKSTNTAFSRSMGRDEIGYVPSNTQCLKVSSADGRMQVIYPTSSDNSWRVMGWITEYVYLGEDFYASVYCTANGNVVSNDLVNVSGRQYNGDDRQKWHFYKCDGENGYTLRNMADYKMLTADYSAYVSDENRQDNQVWYISRNDDGSYSLISKANRGIALDLGGASSEEGADILTIEAHSDWASQKWMIQKYDVYGNELNLGEHFYARIQNNKSQTFLTEVDGDVQGYHDLKNNSQIWEFTRNGNGSYRIQSVDTGEYMQIDREPDEDGTNIICREESNNARSDWFIYQVDDGYSLYPSVSHTQAMELCESYEGDQGIIQTWTIHREWETQRFNIIKGFVMLDMDSNPGKTISESIYRIESSVDESFEIGIAGNWDKIGENVQVWDINKENPYSQFAFVYMDDGYYMIISEGSGLALEVSGSGAGANIQQGKITMESNQLFRVHPAGEDYYYFVPKSDPTMCVDLQGEKAENGNNVEIWTSLQNRAQIWKLEKHAEKCKPVLWTNLSAAKENETVTVNYAGVSDYSQIMLHVLKDGKEESTKDVTGTSEYKLSFEQEGTYEIYISGSSDEQWYDSRHTEIEVTADKPSVVMEAKESVLTATITKPEKVKYQGIVYGTTEDVSLDKQGRIRIAFTKIAADGTISLDASALKGKNYYFRAYIIYENTNGEEVKEYSDVVNLKHINEKVH